jgi:hypothetical protein
MYRQYHDEYTSLIESYKHHDQEAQDRIAKERADFLKTASFKQRASIRLKTIPWKKYILFGFFGPVLLPIWIVFACSAISVQGLNSRRRTRRIVMTNPELIKMKEEATIVRVTELLDKDSTMALTPKKQGVLLIKDTQVDLPVVLQDGEHSGAATPTGVTNTTTTIPALSKSAQTSIIDNDDDEDDDTTQLNTGPTTSSNATDYVASHSFPHLKNVRQLRLLPVQIEISRNMNRLEWKKNAIHCATAINAHASIIVRERRFSGKDGVSAVQHAVDMFKYVGEDV